MLQKNPATAAKGYGDQYAPSRPSLMMFLIAMGLIAIVAAAMNWQAVAKFVHFAEIKSGLGL
ncbi:MAG TPA: hypothetical protein VGJ08_06415 [Rhizomicrobium sp.]|jgi:uncharacterized membrane protein YidH (DUF202 family)